jgi:hypothetical protein
MPSTGLYLSHLTAGTEVDSTMALGARTAVPRLSEDQWLDAYRAGRYTPEQVGGMCAVFGRRSRSRSGFVAVE